MNVTTFFFGVVTLYIMGQLLWTILKKKKYFSIPKDWPEKKKKEILRWRTYLRPLAIILPLVYFWVDKKFALIFIGCIALVFIILDLVRFFSKRANKALMKKSVIKKREKKLFSTMTSFIVICFIVILIFPKAIAITVIFFLTFGDLAAKVFGIYFGRKKIFNKTLEGTLSYFATCLFVGFFLSHFLALPVIVIITGALVAALTELFSRGIDDNFTVGLVTPVAMYIVYYFLI